MTFPLGGDFPRSVNNTFNLSSGPRPNSDQDLVSKAAEQGAGTVFASADGATGAYVVSQLQSTVQQILTEVLASIQKTGNSFIAKFANFETSGTFFQQVPSNVSSFWKMAQFNPGDLPRGQGIFSELFVYDVVSHVTIVNSVFVYVIEQLAASLQQVDEVDSFGNIVQTDYYSTISGSDDICVGDGSPPIITYHSPTASGTVLRPRDQIVDFSLIDAVGGVDLSTVNVTIQSSVSGTIPLVVNGTDATGGQVSITGDPSGFRFTYATPFEWGYNEEVIVTISGSDLAPLVGGNPFFCGASVVNTFLGDITFKVLNQDDFPASITAQPDLNPPFISQQIPASGTLDNSVFTPVTIGISDALTGVDLSTIVVSVNGTTIVNNGIPVTEETVLTGTPTQYVIKYSPTSAFTYGTTVPVSIFAQDREIPANTLSTSYDFSFIDEGTLIIENFLPAVGTTSQLDRRDIEVDIRDDTYGVDASQSFFVINGTIVSGTQTATTSGIHLEYHPPNDFAFDEPIKVTVHAVNGNTISPVVKEAFFTLFYGCRVALFDGGPYAYGEDVDVFIRARNIEKLHRDLSTGYFFTAYTQPSVDMGASIFACNPIADLPASITAQGPEHRYGETVTVRFFVADLDGHELGPYTFTYTIEDKP